MTKNIQKNGVSYIFRFNLQRVRTKWMCISLSLHHILLGLHPSVRLQSEVVLTEHGLRCDCSPVIKH